MVDQCGNAPRQFRLKGVAAFATLSCEENGELVSDLRASIFAPVLRGLERVLPAPVYCGLLYPVAWARAFLHRWIKGPPPIVQLAGLPGFRPARATMLYRLPVYLHRTFEFLPDRLADSKWSGHCRFNGLEPVQRLVATGRPVVLGFVHFGPFVLLRDWLRAAGLPVAMFVGGEARSRATLKRRKDRWALLPEVALTFYQDQLAEAIRHLKRGRVLGIALDACHGRQVEVPVGDGWRFQVATGPIRLARRHGAALVPGLICGEQPWHARVELGAPVPKDCLAAGETAAGADLMAKLMPALLAHPDDWTPRLAARFSRISEPSSGIAKTQS